MIRNRVQEYRIKKKMTQQQLADAVNVTRQTIIAIEKENYTPSVELAIKIARYFRTATDKLFFITDSL